MNVIPERLINCKVYNDSADLLGIADITFPDIENMSETMSGAGIAGEVESPTLGHYGAMTLTINWRVINKSSVSLAVAKAHSLDIRAAIQQYDAGEGEYKTQPVKLFVKGLPKKIGLGKAEAGTTMDASTDLEVVYIKLDIDNINLFEIDKFNYKCVINGVDLLSDVRAALGLY